MLEIRYKQGGVFRKLNPFYTNVNYDDKLDGYGSFDFLYPKADPKSDFLTKRNECQIWEDGQYKYGGYITTVDTSLINNTPNVHVQGVGYMEEFVNELTVPNVTYNNEFVKDLLNPSYAKTLVRPNNWVSIYRDVGEVMTYLSSLQTSMNTFAIITRQLGIHFRYKGDNNNVRTIEFDPMGLYGNVRVRQKPDTYTQNVDNLLFIDDQGVTVQEDSLNVVNYLYVLGGGGGNGINQLTLRDTDPSVVKPQYPILIDPQIPNADTNYPTAVYSNNKTGPNNSQMFYIKDDASIATYGRIKKAVNFPDIFPIPSTTSYSNADRIRGANELYKAAVQYLKMNKDSQFTYTFSCVGNAPTLRVGDVITFKYKGEIKKLNERGDKRILADIDQSLYVLSYKVSYLQEDLKKYTLQVTNIPVQPASASGLISNVVQAISTSTKQRAGSVSTYSSSFDDSFDASYPADFLYYIPTQIVFTDYIYMKIRIKNFRSYANSVGGAGATNTTTSNGGGSFASTTYNGSLNQTTSTDGAVVVSSVSVGNHYHGYTTPSHQHFTGIPLGDSNFGTPLYYRPQSPSGLFTPGGGGVFAQGSDYQGYSSQTAYGGGAHSHNVGVPSHYHGYSFGDHAHNVNVSNHQHSFSIPSHVHQLAFGIYEDTQTATNIKIFIDGVDYSSQLQITGLGDFPSGNTSVYNVLQASVALGQLDNILTPGTHSIKVTCDSGRAKVNIQIYNQFYLSSR